MKRKTNIQKLMALIGSKGGQVRSQAKKDAAKLRAKAQWANRNRRHSLQGQISVRANEISGAQGIVNNPDASVTIPDNSTQPVNR